MTKNALALTYAHILNRAHNEFNCELGRTWQRAVRNGWYFVSLRDALTRGVVRFSYWKRDGSLREARGTLSQLLIPTDDLPKGVPNPNPCYSSIAYYDIDKKAWRSFSITCFVGFVDFWLLVGDNFKKPQA